MEEHRPLSSQLPKLAAPPSSSWNFEVEIVQGAGLAQTVLVISFLLPQAVQFVRVCTVAKPALPARPTLLWAVGS